MLLYFVYDHYRGPPVLKELRAQQRELQEKRDELLDRINNETAPVVDLKVITEYVSDLK